MPVGIRVVVAFAVVALVACGHSEAAAPSSEAAASATPVLVDIAGVADLQERFNQDAGSARLILLVSPT